MIVTCPACATRFLVDPAALGPGGRTVRCARCAETWFQAPPPDPAPARLYTPDPVVTPPPVADGSPAVPTERMPSFIGSRSRSDARNLPALKSDRKRDFLLLVDGWAKDGDYNTAFSQSVEPLPFHAMASYPYPAAQRFPDDAAHREYREQYNTRPALRLLRSLIACTLCGADPSRSAETAPHNGDGK